MRALLGFCCLCLVAGCAPRPPDGLHSALSARFGPKAEIADMETEPKGSRATCGFMKNIAGQDGTFVFSHGALKTGKDPGFVEIYQRECPSAPAAIYVVGLITDDTE